MSPPDIPGYPGRPLPPKEPPERRERQEQRTRPSRVLSPPEMPATLPEPPRVPIEATRPEPKPSVFSQLTPDKRIVNVCSVILTLCLGGGGAVAVNSGKPDEGKAAALEATVEALTGKVNQLETRVRLNESRQKDLEAMSATAHAQAPCVSKKVGLRTELVCGGYELEGFPAVRATIKSERMDPPTFRVELSDGTQPTPWPKL